jgi:hypothetical protein
VLYERDVATARPPPPIGEPVEENELAREDRGRHAPALDADAAGDDEGEKRIKAGNGGYEAQEAVGVSGHYLL